MQKRMILLQKTGLLIKLLQLKYKTNILLLTVNVMKRIFFLLFILFSISFLFIPGCRHNDEITEQPYETTPEIPTLNYPLNETVTNSTSVTFSWTCLSGADTYTLQISKNNSFTQLVYNQNGLTELVKRVSNLEDSTQYFWRVNATNNIGVSGWSEPVWSFIINGSSNSQRCPETPTVTYAGKTNNTILIGRQCWLKENLNVGDMIFIGESQFNDGIIEKYCYNNHPENCNTYGGLYMWDEAMNYTTIEKARGICPPGWHIPSYSELQTLGTNVGNDGNALKAIGEGTGAEVGTNTSGFSALLAGYTNPDGIFGYINISAYFWSSTKYDAVNAYYNNLFYNGSRIYYSYSNKEHGFSIRCIKDN